MKISKLLPITMLVALGMSVTASQALEASDPLLYQLTVPEYIKITSESTKQTGTLSFSDDYAGFTVNAMDATFRVVSNAPEKKVVLTATTKSSDGVEVNALGGTAANPYVVFANTTVDYVPTLTQIQNATNAPAKAENPNCFGLSLTPGTVENDINDSFTDANYAIVGEDANGADRALQGTLTNGITTLPFTFGTSNDVAETFSLHDTMGEYQATLTMTEVAL